MLCEEHISENIKKARLESGLSQQAVANKCGFSNTILSQYENGRKTPSLLTAAKIAKALGISIDQLLYGDENTAFISAESDNGRKIVNAIYLLWSEGVVSYQGFFSSGHQQTSDMPKGEKADLSLDMIPHYEPIKRLINTLNEFKLKKETYPDPDAYLEMIFASVANEINSEIETEDLDI